MADRLELEARFNDHASAGVKRLGKTLDSVKPSNGMQAASAWMKDFRTTAEKANVAVRPMTTTLTALGVGGLAASMSLGEIVKQMRDLGDSTLTMKELGRQSGMTMDQIRRLNYAAGKLHVDPAAVTNAIKSWSNQMLDFRTTRSEFYRQLMHNNNADVAKKIAADSPEQGFKDTLDYLSRIPAAAMKAGKSQADAMQIQRRMADMAGVGDMVPALAQGPEGIRDAMAEAAQNVKPMTAEMVAAAEKMNSSTNRMNHVVGQLQERHRPDVPRPHVEDDRPSRRCAEGCQRRAGRRRSAGGRGRPVRGRAVRSSPHHGRVKARRRRWAGPRRRRADGRGRCLEAGRRSVGRQQGRRVGGR